MCHATEWCNLTERKWSVYKCLYICTMSPLLPSLIKMMKFNIATKIKSPLQDFGSILRPNFLVVLQMALLATSLRMFSVGNASKLRMGSVSWSTPMLIIASASISFLWQEESTASLYFMERVVLTQYKGFQEMSLSLKSFCVFWQHYGCLLSSLRSLNCMSLGISCHLC